ncbi:MAG: flagellar basal body P-ring protein FlgI [Arcobacteraceae bacterium]
MKNFLLTILLSITIYGQTIKDISNIVGIRENQLIGHGLVVGLAGTGDKSQFTMQSLQNLLRNSYIKIPASAIKSKNIATVMVTAVLPPFTRQGDKLKLSVSSIGDAKSIDGGQLLLTQLKGVDGKVYALAQGSIVANDDIKTSGYIYEGAIVENEVEYSLKDEKYITLSLLKNDAKIASSIEDKINKKYGKKLAVAYDTRTIEVTKPVDESMIRFISEIQSIKMDTMMKNKVIIDPKKEIIIAGADITINPVTISRKNFTIRIKKSGLSDKAWEDPVANPGVNVGDDTRVEKIPGVAIPAIDIDNALVNTKAQPTVSDLMRAMKTMKLDIMEIIETIKMLDSLGAINADVEMVR